MKWPASDRTWISAAACEIFIRLARSVCSFVAPWTATFSRKTLAWRLLSYMPLAPSRERCRLHLHLTYFRRPWSSVFRLNLTIVPLVQLQNTVKYVHRLLLIVCLLACSRTIYLILLLFISSIICYQCHTCVVLSVGRTVISVVCSDVVWDRRF